MTTPILSSDGLRQYHDLCVKPVPAEILSQTWHVHSGWVEKHVAQDAIITLYLMLLDELGRAGPEEVEDALLGACEIVDYALTEESRKKVEDAIDEKCRVEDPERYKLRLEARARVQPLVAPPDGGSDSSTR